MKKIYLVLSKLKSNHVRVLASFESESLAGIYRRHKEVLEGHEYVNFHVVEVPLMDGTPEMNEIVLSGSRKQS